MWTAIYNDNSSLKQFELDGKENPFGAIDQSKLDRFIVANKFYETIVNLKTGEIKVNGIKLDFCYTPCLNYRLIYFRRNRQFLGPHLEKIGEPKVNEHVGWQSTIPGRDGPINVKRIIGLYDDRITIQCE